jgi:hypothetical protein
MKTFFQELNLNFSNISLVIKMNIFFFLDYF